MLQYLPNGHESDRETERLKLSWLHFSLPILQSVFESAATTPGTEIRGLSKRHPFQRQAAALTSFLQCLKFLKKQMNIPQDRSEGNLSIGCKPISVLIFLRIYFGLV